MNPYDPEPGDEQPTQPHVEPPAPWWSSPPAAEHLTSGQVSSGGWADTAPQPPYAADAPRRQRRGLRLAALVAAGALVGGAGGVAIGATLVGSDNGSSTTTSVNLGAQGSPVSSPSVKAGTAAAVAKAVLPSVVSINVSGQQQQDTGSGIILRSDGYILTNNHVVSAAIGGGSVSVTFNDGSSASARIVGADATYDLAVIKVNRTGLDAATLGDSATLQVGDPVLAIGSPLGLQGTVTEGIVSALNRPVETSDQQQQDPFGFGFGQSQPSTTTVTNAIQTDAAINPGNSGGALVDLAGQVIGVNQAIASVGGIGGESGNIGVGFAIPINEAKVTASQLIATGHATHPILGVSIADATTSTGQTRVLVQQVVAGGPAAKAGLKQGDIITAINGTRISSSDALIAAIRSHQPGDKVHVTYSRNGSSHTVTATLADSTASQG